MRSVKPSGDEVWEVDSDGSDDTGTSGDTSGDSDTEPQHSRMMQKSAGPLVLPSVMKTETESQSESESESDEDIGGKVTFSSCPVSRPGPQSKMPPLATQLVAKLPPPEAAPRSARGQVTYLRRENELLRNAIAQLQKEAEKVAQQDPGESKTLDFAHLLELAREFGEDFDIDRRRDDCDGEDASTAAPCSISISTPNSSPRDLPLSCGCHDVAELRAQLAESRREASQLKAQIAVRDSELAMLREAARSGSTLGSLEV